MSTTVNHPFKLRAHHASEDPLLRDGRAARAMRVLVDAPIWERVSDSDELPDVALRELLQSDRVNMTLYGDEGPPADVERRSENSIWGGGEAVGWTVVTHTDDQMVPYKITTATDKTVTEGALFGDQVLIAKLTLQRETGTEDKRDALLIAVAHEVHADMLITERASLLSTSLMDSGNTQVAAPADALALVALYLRADGRFVSAKFPRWSFEASPTRFYEHSAEAHLPSLAPFAHRAGGRVSPARVLTVLSRARALFKSRDRIALLSSEQVTEDLADEVSFTFTHALVDMVAFHDVLARIVNDFLDVPEKQPRQIKWQNPGWRQRVIEQFPGLRDAWSEDGYAKNINDALRVGRNEIHDVAPVIVPFQAERGAPQVGLAFHVDIGTRVHASLAALSDERSSGISRVFSNGHLLDPHLFYEFVLPWMVRSVDDILTEVLRHLPDRPLEERSTLLPVDMRLDSLRAIQRLSQP